ncbi:hypothetical protein ACFLQU_01130 [Verrucomicrobiota bacterium]
MKGLVFIAILLVVAGGALGYYQWERVKTIRIAEARLARYQKAAEADHAELKKIFNTLSNLHRRVSEDQITMAAMKDDVLGKVSPSALSAAKPLPKSQRERMRNAPAPEPMVQPRAAAPARRRPEPAAKVPRGDDAPPDGMLTREQLEARRRRGPDSRGPEETDWMPPGMPLVDPLEVERHGPDDDVPAGMLTREQLEARRNKKSGGPPPERKWKRKSEPERREPEKKKTPWPNITPRTRKFKAPPPKPRKRTPRATLLGSVEEQTLFATRIQELAMDVNGATDMLSLSKAAVADMVDQAVRKLEKVNMTMLPGRALDLACEIRALRKAAEAKVAMTKGIRPELADALEEGKKIQMDLNEILTRRREKAEQLRKELERKELIASEVSGAHELRAQNAQLFKMYEFDKAMAALKTEKNGYETEEGHAVLNILIDRCSRLQKLKTFFVERLTEQPFRWGWQQSGDRRDILGADAKVVKIKGEEIAWGEIGPEQVTSIIDHCFTDPPGLELIDVGRLRLAVTVFWQEHERLEEAKKEGDKALRCADELQTEHKALFDQFRSLSER